MTIVTKPLSDKKQDQLKKPLVAAGADATNNNVDVEVGDEPEAPPKVTSGTLFALFLISVLVMGIGVVGGLYLYQHLGKPHRIHKWLELPQRLTQSEEAFKERFDIDLENELADITVPDFGPTRRGRFIHDFNSNKTGIVDLDGGRCFVMPLNRNRVLPPRSMVDLLGKIWDGYYEVDTEVVRETYRVELPPITSAKDMGKFIYRECAGVPTYRLRRSRDFISKRSLVDTQEYQEFAGNKMASYKIIMSGVSEYEKEQKLAQKV